MNTRTTTDAHAARGSRDHKRVHQVIDYLDDLLRLKTRATPDLDAYPQVLWLANPEEGSVDAAGAALVISKDAVGAQVDPTGETLVRVEAERHRAAFDALFEIKQRLRGDGGEQELVLGALLLRAPGGKHGPIRRHLLTAPVRLQLEDDALVVRATAHATIRLELDMLEPSARVHGLGALNERLRNEPPDRLLDPHFLREWSSLLASAIAGGAVDETSRDATKILDAPALLLRPRPTQVTADVLRRLRDQANRENAILPLLLDVAECPSSARAPLRFSDSRSRPLFPLPTNPEQREVHARMQTQAGVLVQGPPGTGKTHTIANLVSHLIAENKRVLVTAKNPRALRVLGNMLPPELRPLCVSSLGSGDAEQRELEGSIRSLTDRHARLDRRQNTQRIAALEERLRRTEAEETELRGRWLYARRAETVEVDLGDGWRGTPAAISRRLAREAALDWIPDRVAMNPPLKQDARLFAACIAPPEEIALDDRDAGPGLGALRRVSEGELQDLLAAAVAAGDCDPIDPSAGAGSGSEQLSDEQIADAQERILTARGRLTGLLERARAADAQHLDCGGTLDLRTLIQEACDEQARRQQSRGARRARRWFGLLPARERAIDRVRLDGRRATEPDVLPEVLAHLETRREIAILWRALAAHGTRPGGTLAEQVASAERLTERWADQHRRTQRARELLARHKDDGAFAAAANGAGSLPSIVEAGRIAEHELERRSRAQAGRQWQAHIDALRAGLPGLAERLIEQTSRGPRPALHASASDTGIHRWSAEEFPQAVAYARARTWLEDHLRTHDEGSLERRMTWLEEHRRQLTAELAAALGWKHLLEGMSKEQRRHLIAWRQAMGRQASATSAKEAAVHRREARRHLAGCRAAIGAWILPIDQVFETIEPEKGAFDVIIIDEASQCEQHTLPILNYAPRIVVVGDQQQIRPVPVGISHADIERLQREHLGDFVHRDAFLPTQSLLDHAARRFGDPITLREHFRCVPEIIRFSDELCYADAPLVALRRPEEGRLPPLRSLFVEDGEREGEGVLVRNDAEAVAIAKSIRACEDDPRYEGRSFGVIVMQGRAQAKQIEKELARRLSPEEQERRRLACGTPYSFQGDERDVVWISLVAAPNRANAPLVRDDFVRRFNVAMSRARDQVWLAHSVTPDDLSPKDLRRRLLTHFLHAADPSLTEGSTVLTAEQLAISQHGADRTIAAPPHPFETWLQVDIASDLIDAGYVVGSREISTDLLPLVVLDRDRVVVVECVDESLTPEEATRRLERRMILERCGWCFFAVRGSEYQADRLRVLQGLADALEDAGIAPRSERDTDSDRDRGNTGRSADGSRSSTDLGGEALTPPRTQTTPRDAQVALVDPASAGDHDLYLEPFVGWPERPLPAPRSDDLGPTVRALVEIAEVEGPAVCSRLYRRLVQASCFDAVTPGVGLLLDEAMRRAISEGWLEPIDEETDPALHTVRVPGQPDVLTRTRGDREFAEIPPEEVRRVAAFVERTRPRASRTRICRSVFRVFDVPADEVSAAESSRLRAILTASPLPPR